MTLNEALKSIKPVDEKSGKIAHEKQNNMAIPLGSLGLLGTAIERLASASANPSVNIDKRTVVVFCADNGVVNQGVTQCGQEVTAIVTENLAKEQTTVCIMSKKVGVDVLPVDIGVYRDVVGDKILNKKLMYGTNDFTQEVAIPREIVVKAIEIGIEIAKQQYENKVTLLATGEMGIGNTTTSSAVASVLLDEEVEVMTGRGAGLSSDGLNRKIMAIKNAIELHNPDKTDVLDVLSKVGGLDIAGMVGLYIGGAVYRVPVVIDGFISSVAALCAVRMCEDIHGYLIASHVSAEPAGQKMLDELKLEPLICAGMRLGEGTGAVCAISLLDTVLAVYHEMAEFEDVGIERYVPLC